MRRSITTFSALIALLVAGLWVASSVLGGDDPRREGDVIRTQTHPDGSTDIYREHANGEVVIEHQEPEGEIWFESNEVIGQDGEPVTCPDGQPLRIALDAPAEQPSPSEALEAQKGMPKGKRAVFNEYTGEFQAVEATEFQLGDGTVTAQEPLVYQCGPNNEPVLVPLSQVDAEAAEDARRQLERGLGDPATLRDVTGLGEDPASDKRSPGGS